AAVDTVVRACKDHFGVLRMGREGEYLRLVPHAPAPGPALATVVGKPDASANCAYHGRIALSHNTSSLKSYVSRWSLRPLLPLEPDILEGRTRVQGDRVDRVLRDPRSHAYEPTQVHNRSKHHALDSELLNVVQNCFPFGAVALLPLLLEECIDIWITPIGIGPLGVHKRFHTRPALPGPPTPRPEDPAHLFLPPGRIKGGPLHGPHAHPNADRVQVIHHGLADLKERGNRHQFPRVKTIGIARLAQQLLGLLRIIGERLGWQGEVA